MCYYFEFELLHNCKIRPNLQLNLKVHYHVSPNVLSKITGEEKLEKKKKKTLWGISQQDMGYKCHNEGIEILYSRNGICVSVCVWVICIH